MSCVNELMLGVVVTSLCSVHENDSKLHQSLDDAIVQYDNPCKPTHIPHPRVLLFHPLNNFDFVGRGPLYRLIENINVPFRTVCNRDVESLMVFHPN